MEEVFVGNAWSINLDPGWRLVVPLVDRLLMIILFVLLGAGVGLLCMIIAELRRLRRQRERHQESDLIRHGESIDRLRGIQRAIRAHGVRLAEVIELATDDHVFARDTPVASRSLDERLPRPPAMPIVEEPMASAERRPGADEEVIETTIFQRASAMATPTEAD